MNKASMTTYIFQMRKLFLGEDKYDLLEMTLIWLLARTQSSLILQHHAATIESEEKIYHDIL